MNYEHIQLESICDFVSGGTPDTMVKEYWEGDIPWITGADIQDDRIGKPREHITPEAIQNSATNLVPRNSVLLATRTGVGKVAINDFDICISQDFTAVIPDRSKLIPEFLYYGIQANRRYLRRNQRGATIQGVTREVVQGLSLYLPPLAEQEHIAAILENADRLRRLRRFAQKLSDSFIQSLFLKMFGDPVENPLQWPLDRLGNTIDGFKAGANYPPIAEGEDASSWRVLKISAVTWGEFNPNESKPIGKDIDFDESIIVRQGDLLMSRANTSQLVGAVSKVREKPPKVLLPDKLWRICLFEDSKIASDYMLYALRESGTRRLIEELATGTSGSMKNISMAKAKTLPITVPPFHLQERFVEIVHTFETIRRRQREAKRENEQLFQSLLHRAFQGEL